MTISQLITTLEEIRAVRGDGSICVATPSGVWDIQAAKGSGDRSHDAPQKAVIWCRLPAMVGGKKSTPCNGWLL